MGCVDDLGRFGESLLAWVDHRRESIVAFAFRESFGALVDLGLRVDGGGTEFRRQVVHQVRVGFGLQERVDELRLERLADLLRLIHEVDDLRHRRGLLDGRWRAVGAVEPRQVVACSPLLVLDDWRLVLVGGAPFARCVLLGRKCRRGSGLLGDALAEVEFDALGLLKPACEEVAHAIRGLWPTCGARKAATEAA